jgi:hypothetical protein
MSKLQNIVSLSTIEAKLVVYSHACKGAIWLTSLLGEFGRMHDKLKLFCDSQSYIHLAKNPSYHSKTKHIPVKYHVVKVHTKENCADIFKKLVLLEKMKWFLDSLHFQGRS